MSTDLIVRAVAAILFLAVLGILISRRKRAASAGSR